jgi:rare lipoprotein A
MSEPPLLGAAKTPGAAGGCASCRRIEPVPPPLAQGGRIRAGGRERRAGRPAGTTRNALRRKDGRNSNGDDVMRSGLCRTLPCLVLAGLAACTTPAAPPAAPAPQAATPEPAPTQIGQASYYGPEFNGRKTASGTRFDPNSDTAAHRTLPLGTVAEVKNLETGRTARVTIRDRGPYVRGRVVDLSPRTAEHLGMKRQGIAPVEVRPIAVPPGSRGELAEAR